ncbi:hypothetical protein MMC15_002186 [Xylographa vitiligo]|nr:hypothetical protein [Xylographa vitiligo]
MTFRPDILIALDWTAEPFQAWTNEDLSSGISRHVATVSSDASPKWLSHMASRGLKDQTLEISKLISARPLLQKIIQAFPSINCAALVGNPEHSNALPNEPK